jgi:uncharacterized membrane protein
MWFIGLIIGLVVGAAVEDFEGAFYGAALGALAGYALRLALGRSAEERLRALEREVAHLRRALQAQPAQPPVVRPPVTREERAVEAPRVAEPFPEFEITPEPTPRVEPALEIEREPEPAPIAAAPASSERPAAPAERPAWLSWLLGGNTVVRVGVVVLFFGVAFLLKYAYEHTHVPIEVRLTAVAAGAIAMLFLGWRLRLRRAGYALALQGGGIGVLYLTVFASLRLFGLLPPGAAFALLLLIAVLSAALAILQSSQSLAILGAGGGFLAPILTSTGGGSHVMLFSYYAVLNAGILTVAWYRSWRPLNLVGFAFTFGIGAAWGMRFYRPELYASTQPFLLLFFFMYLAIPVLFAQRQATRVERYLDATLVFGVPLLAFGFQLRLMRDIEYGAAFSALGMSLVYVVLARLLYTRHRELLRMLVEAFLALGVVFVTLAIPLALDGRWTAAAWALEGAAVVWVGVRQSRWSARAFGLLLQLGAGISFLSSASAAYGELPVFNSFYVGCVLVALAGLFSNWYLDRHREALKPGERWAVPVAFVWGLAWWTFGGLLEIEDHTRWELQPDLALLFFTGSAAVFSLLWQRIAWRLARYPALALLPLMAASALAAAVIYDRAHPFAGLGWLAWPLALGVHLWLLRRHEGTDEQARALGTGWLDHLHAGFIWVLAAVGAWEVAWGIDQLVAGQAVWPLIAWALVPAALLVLLALRGERIAWPVRAHLGAYLVNGAAPLAAFLWGWTIYVNAASNGDPAPLPYLPILSPLDLAQIGALLVIVLWLQRIQRLELVDLGGERAVPVYACIGAAAFIAANGILLRTLHHWAGVPFHLEAMLRSMLVQAALSIFWSVLAMCTMVIATRLKLRALWITGAALMGVVVVKLFLVDLSNVGGVERIVSFIGVGLLMLLIGYVSPVPPRIQEQTK